MIRRLLCASLALAVLAMPLGGCAINPISRITAAVSAAEDASIPFDTVKIAVASYVAVEKTAKNYIVFCTPNPAPAGCNDTLIQKTINPAITKGSQAANAFIAFYQVHPGQLGSKGLYDALVAATTLLTNANIPSTPAS